MNSFASVMRRHSLYLLSAMTINVLVMQGGFSGTDAMTLQTITGQTPYAYFGRSVANAGDVNGDGHPDLIVGNYISYAGRAYIYFGGQGLDTIPDVTMINHDGNDFFGFPVAGAGDVNGDGYADVVVGAHVSGQYGLDSGRVYIFFGGALMDSIPDVVMAGLPGELFGYSVAGAGDVNNDGYAEVIVGAYGSDAGGLDAGRAYIFFGGATVDNVPDVVITGTYLENLGYSVAGAGDVNNDGFDDVLVGGPGYVLTSAIRGRAYVYFGGSPMNTVPDVVTATGDRAGQAVAAAGDINGDGYSDVLVTDVRSGGRVLVYYGGSPMNSVADVTLNGEGTTDNFGYAAASAGDINGDGYADIIIGAAGDNSSTGRVYVYCGGVSMDTIPDLTFIGEAGSDRFGGSVAGAGDVDGDGTIDLIASAPSNNAGGLLAGRAYLYLNAGPLPIQLASFTATAIGQHEVRLGWTTLSELNNYGFEVQRKRSDEPQFVALPNSFIPGHGTTNVPHSYSFIDSMVTPNQWSYRLKQIDLDGLIHYSDAVTVHLTTAAEEPQLPTLFSLEQNYPNPFNPATQIRFSLPVESHVRVAIYSMLGQEVRALADEQSPAGYFTVEWNGENSVGNKVSSGVYFYRMEAAPQNGEPTFVSLKKTILLK